MTSAAALVDRAGAHRDWREILQQALDSLPAQYLDSLLNDDSWLPGAENLLAAFRRDRAGLRYLLIGESPYPRRESANGIAFYDAAVKALWSDGGLSKAVNRATSLRNIVKTARISCSATPTARSPRRRLPASIKADSSSPCPSCSATWNRPGS
jgi:uracil-DNA glycosylase